MTAARNMRPPDLHCHSWSAVALNAQWLSDTCPECVWGFYPSGRFAKLPALRQWWRIVTPQMVWKIEMIFSVSSEVNFLLLGLGVGGGEGVGLAVGRGVDLSLLALTAFQAVLSLGGHEVLPLADDNAVGSSSSLSELLSWEGGSDVFWPLPLSLGVGE